MTRRDSHHDTNWLGILAVVLAGLFVFSVISYIWMPFLPWAEQREAGEEITEDTYDAENALKHYEEFRDMYHDIQAQREEVRIAHEEHEQFHETWEDDEWKNDRQAKERHSRIHTRMTGTQNQLEQLVADYNAKSDKANQEVFKCNLPYQVDDRFAIEGPPGSGPAEEPQDVGPDGEPVDPNGEVPPPEQCDGLPEQMEA